DGRRPADGQGRPVSDQPDPSVPKELKKYKKIESEHTKKRSITGALFSLERLTAHVFVTSCLHT
ncbi:MAG: hypothetical protein IIY45_09495, partial [Firmicutes bacterium]|nr:hypothetical protein [Bacillota bacterium]